MLSNTDLYNNMTFADIYESYPNFKESFEETPFSTRVEAELITDEEDKLELIYYLLYARFGNNPIRNNDLNQFNYKVASLLYQHAVIWSKKDEVQKKIRALSEADILSGAKQIHNLALNPQTEPGTDTEDNLSYINQQDAINYKKSKMDAYIQLYSLLDEDYTKAFLDKFESLFRTIYIPDACPIYVTEEEDD